ncbi:MAG: aminotransferase class V-fold PLP-dependent enzyme [Actinobacteria bacterium]|nr:aminotransferase class V-fold PLP-dependent enzyme [Actinomycetota bacterium]
MSEPHLPADEVARLHRRAAELLPLGSLLQDGDDMPAAWTEALDALAERLGQSYPFADPQYLGQMLKPPHPVAWAGYAMAMLLNSNNHAFDGGPATAHLEREAVDQIAQMLHQETHLSHLTASGTIANLEALWVARSLHPDKVVLSGAQAHYTHARISEVVGAQHETVPATGHGTLDLAALEERLQAGGVGTVVATLGSTGLGMVDRVDRVADLCQQYDARLHVDAAYGGFFALLADGGTPGVERAPFAALGRADSIAIDPHKHGLQPYGCGCIIFRDPDVGRLYKHDSPYTYFTSDDLHPGEISLECSRSGASAAALWATLRALPLTRGGLGSHLAGARSAALRLAERIRGLDGWTLVLDPDLDIVCWHRTGTTASGVSAATDVAYDRLAERGWHVAKLSVSAEDLHLDADQPTVMVLRTTLMKPEHAGVVDALADTLAELT